MDNAELLRRYLEDHSQEAFTALVRGNLDLVYSAALRQVGGDPHRAQEVAQQVFTDLARKAPALAGHTALTGWLYTSTHFAAAKLRRTEKRRQARESEAVIMDELLASAESGENWGQLRPVLDEVMHELNSRDRDAILLRFFEQRSFAEVGRQLGLGENAARMCVERALDKLGGLLAKRGVNSTASALAILLTSQTVVAAPGGLVATIASGALAPWAAAAAGPGTVAGIINFMSSTKVILGVSAIGVLAVGTGVYYARRAATTEARMAAAATESDQILRRWRALPPRIAAAETALPSSPTAEAVPDPAPTAEPAVAVPAAAGGTLQAAVVRDLTSDPQFNALMQEIARVRIGEGYGVFYHDLGLTPAQIGQFEALLLQAKAEAWRVRVAQQVEGRAPRDPTTRELLRQAKARLEENIRGLLGESGLQRFRDYDRSWGTQYIAERLAGAVFFTETPLTENQASQLAGILAHHSPEFRAGGFVDQGKIEWDQAIAAAGRILTPPQLAALRGIRSGIEYSQLNAAAVRAAGRKSP